MPSRSPSPSKKSPVKSQSFYCVKCKSKKDQVPKKCVVFKTKSGRRHALKAKCNDCGTKLTKFCTKEVHKSVKKSLRKSH